MADLSRFTYEELLEQFYGTGKMKVENPLTVKEALELDKEDQAQTVEMGELNSTLKELTQAIEGLIAVLGVDHGRT